MKPRFLLFDMDGLMADSEKLAFTVIGEILQEYGYELTIPIYQETIGISQQEAAAILSGHFPGVDGQTQVYDVMEEHYREAVKAGRLEAKSGLYELLDELDERKIRRAVASSNVKEVLMANLQGIHIEDRMDAVVYDGLVEHVKPYPDLFLKAAALLGAKPEECLVLEDSPAGVRAAHAAGIPVIVIPDLIVPSREIEKLCLYRMQSLWDVIDYIRREDIRGVSPLSAQ